MCLAQRALRCGHPGAASTMWRQSSTAVLRPAELGVRASAAASRTAKVSFTWQRGASWCQRRCMGFVVDDEAAKSGAAAGERSAADRYVEVRRVLEDGTEYEGDWDMDTGRPHGHGRATYPDSGVYEGHWVNGTRTGQGCITTPEWSYEGEFAADDFAGRGLLTMIEDGTTMEGEWAGPIAVGEVTITWAGGDSYCGTVDELGAPHGKGVYTTAQGQVHDGEWDAGKKAGEGRVLDRDGEVIFEGPWAWLDEED